MGKELRRPDQGHLAALLHAFSQHVDPIPSREFGQNPFIKPDLKAIIAQAASQVACPILLGAVVAQKDVVWIGWSGHLFFLFPIMYQRSWKVVQKIGNRVIEKSGTSLHSEAFLPGMGWKVPTYQILVVQLYRRVW